jgi:hypothetical protein
VFGGSMNSLINTPVGDIFSFVKTSGITYYAEFSGKNQWQTNNYALLCHVEQYNNDFDNDRHVDGRYKLYGKYLLKMILEKLN